MSDITDIAQANRLIDQLLHFETVVNSLALELMNTTLDTFETKIRPILQYIADYEQAVSGYLFLLDSDAKTIQQIFRWTGETGAGSRSAGMAYEHLAWLIEHLSPGRVLTLAAGNLPDETRQALQLAAEHTLLAVPLIIQNRMAGFLSLNCPQVDSGNGTGKLAVWAAALMAARLDDLRQRQQTEAALKNEIHLFRTLIDALPSMIYVKDTESRFLVGNKAVVEDMGLQYEHELLGKSDADFHPPQMAAIYRADELAIMTSGQALINHEEPVLDRETGQIRRWFSSNKIPLRDSEGRVIGLMGINHDITARKQSEIKLAEQREILRLVINNLPDLIFMKDTEGHFQMVNKVLMEQMGVSSEDEVIGKTDFDFFPREMAEQYRADEQAILVSGQAKLNYEEQAYNHTLGAMRWLSSNKIPLRAADGRIIGLVGINHDITEQKVLTQNLEKQVATRTAELERAHEQLKREMAERQQQEAEYARLQHEVIESQKQAILELSTPIIPIIEKVLVMPLIGTIDTARATNITRALLAGISQHRARVVILDITGVSIVDTGVANHLNRTMHAARLKGVRTIVTGISDAIAETIVDLGIDWGAIDTVRDLQSGLHIALQYTGYHLAALQEKSS